VKNWGQAQKEKKQAKKKEVEAYKKELDRADIVRDGRLSPGTISQGHC